MKGVYWASRCHGCGIRFKNTEMKKVFSKWYLGPGSHIMEGEARPAEYCRTCYPKWLRAIEELIE